MTYAKLAQIIILALSAVISLPAMAEDYFCTPATAVADVINFSIGVNADTASKSNKILLEQSSLVANLPNNGKAIGTQLSPANLRKFNDLRHQLINLSYQQLLFSDYIRDVRVIASLLEFVHLTNLYNVNDQTMHPADPKRFLYTILSALRGLQPEPSPGKNPIPQKGCTIDLAADLEEDFAKIQLSKSPTDEATLRIIKDIRRARSLFLLASNRLKLSIQDNDETKWNGEIPTMGSNFNNWLSRQPTSVKMVDEKIQGYINVLMPSDKAYETRQATTNADAATKEHPARP